MKEPKMWKCKILTTREYIALILFSVLLFAWGVIFSKQLYLPNISLDYHIEEIRYLDEFNFKLESLPQYQIIIKKDISDFTVMDWWYYKNIRYSYLESLSLEVK
jgi:hypothetical protein